MKIVTDQMSHYSTSSNSLEINTTIPEPDIYSSPDIGQLNGDCKIFPEELSNLCHKKGTDPLNVEIKDYIEQFLGDDCSVVKKIQTEVDHDVPLETCPSKMRTDIDNVQSSADVNSMECENLVAEECFKETDGSVVRDICIDDGVAANDKIFMEDSAVGHKSLVQDQNDAKDTIYVSNNITVEVNWPVVAGLKPMLDEASDFDFSYCDSKVSTPHSENEMVSSDLRDKAVDSDVAEDIYVELLSKTSTENIDEDKQFILHQKSIAEFEDAADTLICSSSTPEATIKETADSRTVETSEMKIDPGPEAANKNSHSLPTAININELELSSNVPYPQMPGQLNLAYEHFTASARIQRDHFDSSFASVGHYTNSIAYSGSLSHRSDASTVSTRSFAFPVLQNEWNFSPVRMQKADRRHLGRRRGWMNGLFCCKF